MKKTASGANQDKRIVLKCYKNDVPAEKIVYSVLKKFFETSGRGREYEDRDIHKGEQG